MGHWNFVNDANFPVNVGIYNGGFLYQYKNHIQPYCEATCEAVDPEKWDSLPFAKLMPHPPKNAKGKYLFSGSSHAGFDMVAVGYDVAVVYDVPGTEFDPKNNWSGLGFFPSPDLSPASS